MNDRYKIINECDHSNIWYKDFPAQLEKTRVLFDSATDKIVIQFKLRNISNKTIDTTYLKIVCCDVSGQEIAVIDEHIMPMLDVVPNNNFGDKNPLFADDKRIASVSVFLTKVVFSDGTTWDNSALDTGVEIEPAKAIPFTGALHKQFLRCTAHINEKIVMFEEYHDYWRCTCGRINLSNSDNCDGCKAKKADLQQCFSANYLKAKLDEYNEQQEIARKDSVYAEALSLSGQCDIADLEKARTAFLSISGWKDSADKIAFCEQRIDELNTAQEKQRAESAKKAKKAKIISAVAAVVVVVGSVFAILCVNVIIPNAKYNNAISLLESGKYDEAYSAFEELGDYSNASEQLPEVRYQQACSYLEQQKFEEALDIFVSLEDYKSSSEKVTESKYQYALWLMDNEDYDSAVTKFRSIIGFKNAEEMANECQYKKAISYIKEGDYDKALTIFSLINGYSDVDEQIKLCQYNQALKYIENNDFEDAFEIYNAISNYNELEELLFSSCYDYAQKLYDKNEYISAHNHFKMIENYRDSAEKMKELSTKDHIIQAMCAQVGDIIEFGTYEQDGNIDNGAEPIEWIVIETNEGKTLLVSKDCLLSYKYGTNKYEANWGQSEARKFLNNVFYINAFTSSEKDIMLHNDSISSHIVDNRDSKINHGFDFNIIEKSISDNVFLLSSQQYNALLNSNYVPQCTETVNENEIIGFALFDNIYQVAFALDEIKMKYVNKRGEIKISSPNGNFGLCPAIWISNAK